MNHLEHIKPKAELRSLIRLKDIYESILGEFDSDKGIFGTPLIFNKELFESFLTFNVDEYYHAPDYNNLLYKKQLSTNNNCHLIDLWNADHERKHQNLIEKLEKTTNDQIDELYYLAESDFKESNRSHSDCYHLFSNIIINCVCDYGISLGSYEEQLRCALIRIQRRIIYLSKLGKLSFCFDKRFQLRQIIKFLFKNLDDSHSSINNSIAKIKNYLLKTNYDEKRKYTWAY